MIFDTSLPSIVPDPRPWAFSKGELTAGLRSQIGDATLAILSIEEKVVPNRRPSMGRIRGLQVECKGISGMQSFNLVIKEPQGTTRTGTAGAGMREMQFYRFLAGQLPILTPKLIVAHPDGEWLALEMLTHSRLPETWSAEDYLRAIEKLVSLHDRFWKLGEDLSAYPWLARPLDADYDIYIQAASSGMRRLVAKVTANLLTRDPALIRLLAKLVENAASIAEALRQQPATLLHGDYWPGNLALLPNDNLYAFDWQQASIGPGVLDLFHFIQASQWYFAPLPIMPETLVSAYRTGLAAASGQVWDNDDWEALWDYALLWTFLCNWVDLLANIPASVLQTRYALMQKLWLNPVSEAIARRLPGD